MSGAVAIRNRRAPAMAAIVLAAASASGRAVARENSPPAPAAPTIPTPGMSTAVEINKAGQSRLSFLAQLDGIYDDNILQLSDQDIRRLESGVSTTRFKISTPDDFVAAGHAGLRWTMRPLPRRDTVLAADGAVYRYSRNSIKNWEELEMSLSQELSASRRHAVGVHAFATWIPSYYLRELTDDDASFEAGRRVRESATYEQLSYGLRVEGEAVASRLFLSGGHAAQRRNYNSFFPERDGTKASWMLGLRSRPLPRYRMQLALSYSRGALDAVGDRPETPFADDDISYRHDGPSLALAFPWGERHRGRLEAEGSREIRRYTTPNRFDVQRYGRVDHRLDVTLRVVQHLAGPVDLVATWRRTSNDASFPPGYEISKLVTDFVQERYGIGLRYRR